MATTTTTTEAAATDATRLQLMWLASPALPVGGFSYSEGLEAAVDAGLVRDEATAAAWLAEQLPLVLARSDGAAMAEACRAWAVRDADAVHALNQWLSQTRETAELRMQAEQMGRSLLEWLRNGPHAADTRIALLAALPPAPTWPVAFALAATLAGATPRDALLAFAWGWAENLAQAAMKAVPLGQAAAQRMLTALAGHIPGAVDTALAMPADERQAFAPGLAILSARHETQYSRLFRS
ncbi:MAG: urease accessory protein UreF [Betaproteobacteria bacterium]|jgi:urease accessory protein